VGEKISVIIPTYNRANLIRRSIMSVLEQTYSNLELIIVDDGSTDDTKSVIEEIGDSRIRYFYIENHGAAYAMNYGVSKAKAEIIAIQDSDDYWEKTKLEEQMKYWCDNPDYKMIYCPFYVETNNECGRHPSDSEENVCGELFYPLLVRNTIGTPTMVIDKNCFNEVGGFDKEFRSIYDWEFVIRFAKRYKIGYVNKVLVRANYVGDDRLSANRSAFYKARLKIVATYKDELINSGLFDSVVLGIFKKAEAQGVLDEVKNALMLMLQ